MLSDGKVFNCGVGDKAEKKTGRQKDCSVDHKEKIRASVESLCEITVSPTSLP